MFQLYNCILNSYADFKSKHLWCRKAMEEIQMQSVCGNTLSHYISSLNKMGGNDATKQLVNKFKDTIRSCKEILCKFEQVNSINKSTELHKAFQIDSMRYLSDIYITQDEMMQFRDSRKDDLKNFENQFDVFEKRLQTSSQDLDSTIDFNPAELKDAGSIKLEFQILEEEFLLLWSIISSMSDDIKRFHTNLRVMESINSTSDEKYEAMQFLSDYKRHENKIEEQKQLKPQMDEHHARIDGFIEQCKKVQVKNAEAIITTVKSLSQKGNDNIAMKSQKMQSNCDLIASKFNYLLKPTELPSLHEKLKKEFARRYVFEDLLSHKEKELAKIIGQENSKRSKFMAENGNILPSNPLTVVLLDYQVELNISRNKKIPRVTDVDTEETSILKEELKKEFRHQEKLKLLGDELKLFKAQMKLKDQQIIEVRQQKADEIERYA